MKDPAFLFYTNDFISGTQFFSDEQLGIYIRLLCAQHQHGHLSKKYILMICKRQDEDTNDILNKFTIDKDGLFFNKRLEFEIERRLKYSLSRSENRRKDKKKMCKRYVKDMETETVIETEDINTMAVKGDMGGINPTIEQIKNYCLERKNNILPEKFFDFYESKGWMIGKNKMKDWRAAIRTWERNGKSQIQESKTATVGEDGKYIKI